MIQADASIDELAIYVQNLSAGDEEDTAGSAAESVIGDNEYTDMIRTSDQATVVPRPALLDLLRDCQLANIAQPDYLSLPLNIDDDSQLGRLFTKFREAGTHMLAQNMATIDVLGVPNVDVDLLFRERRERDPFSACTWACEIARLFRHIDVFTTLAATFLLARFMRVSESAYTHSAM